MVTENLSYTEATQLNQSGLVKKTFTYVNISNPNNNKSITLPLSMQDARFTKFSHSILFFPFLPLPDSNPSLKKKRKNKNFRDFYVSNFPSLLQQNPSSSFPNGSYLHTLSFSIPFW